jgi:hypothetical protein
MVVCGGKKGMIIIYHQRYELQDEYTPRGKSNVEHEIWNTNIDYWIAKNNFMSRGEM